MKKLIVLATVVLASSLSFAADAEHSNTNTVDHSKNPITGTEKTVRKHKKVMKDGAGHDGEATVTETTKKKTDGSVEKKTEVESESAKTH